MITQEMKDKGIQCKGKGVNCYECKSQLICVDYVDLKFPMELRITNNERLAKYVELAIERFEKVNNVGVEGYNFEDLISWLKTN